MPYTHRHRAKTAPATTFIPLFEEMQEIQEQRSRENRKNLVAATMAIQQPFKFDERERVKREKKVVMVLQEVVDVCRQKFSADKN